MHQEQNKSHQTHTLHHSGYNDPLLLLAIQSFCSRKVHPSSQMHILRKLSKIGDPIDKEDMKGLFIPVFIYYYILILDDLGLLQP